MGSRESSRKVAAIITDERLQFSQPMLSHYVGDFDLIEISAPETLIALIAKSNNLTIKRAERKFKRLVSHGLEGLDPNVTSLFEGWAVWKRPPASTDVQDEDPVNSGNGQHESYPLSTELKAIGSKNACTEKEVAWKGAATRSQFQLVRDLAAQEKKLGRKLQADEIRIASDAWRESSNTEVGSYECFEAILATLDKVRIPTGEGETLRKASEALAKIPDAELPVIPGAPDAPVTRRKVLAFHREVDRFSNGKTYFLSCRSIAKATGLSIQGASNATKALVRLGHLHVAPGWKVGPGVRATRFLRNTELTKDTSTSGEQGDKVDRGYTAPEGAKSNPINSSPEHSELTEDIEDSEDTEDTDDVDDSDDIDATEDAEDLEAIDATEDHLLDL